MAGILAISTSLLEERQDPTLDTRLPVCKLASQGDSFKGEFLAAEVDPVLRQLLTRAE